jgi:hypothetical protein
MTEPLRRVKDDSVTVDLKDAGGLRPPSDEEDGKVLRDPDVLSEPPEIDTTRAEPPPRRRLRKGFVVCAALYCASNLLTLFAVVGAIAYYENTCDLSDINGLVTQFNASTATEVASFGAHAYSTIRATLAGCTHGF